MLDTVISTFDQLRICQVTRESNVFFRAGGSVAVGGGGVVNNISCDTFETLITDLLTPEGTLESDVTFSLRVTSLSMSPVFVKVNNSFINSFWTNENTAYKPKK